ncbi:sporulation protein, YlmC/YmxH family [Proteiniborus ethanoligenes]|uniref:Sporulation protein, YlmC/YmxH family n=1 Tax=Proteiniborus ethanoligenes TaxID=415015 RepID=A0A1H3JX43_9FIRM|nr:YlmC/YmxH family sporulation protein [Proteiniborus ethanoligenes]SDY44530.1 sporulation protein, YlmC/YmxH family [Proteiniborus ethanoligenes]
MVKATDLREKEVINVRDGTRLGLISDIEVNLEKGTVEAIMLPGPGRILGLFGKNLDYVIKWQNIVRIGSDVILVDLNLNTEDYLYYGDENKKE